MKVLYIHQHFSTIEGSTGTRSYEFAQELVRRGHEVTMVCGSYQLANSGLSSVPRNGIRTGIVEGIQVVEICIDYANRMGFLKRSLVFLQFGVLATWLALRLEYDLVYATSTPLTAAVPALFAKLFRRKKFVFEVRDLWPELPRAMGVIRNPLILGALGLLERLAYRHADRCVGLAPGICEGIKSCGVAPENIDLVPNACDLDIFQPASQARKRVAFTAVFTGAHGEANGLHAVLDTALELKNRGRTDIKIIFVGEGAKKNELQTRSLKLGLRQVEFKDPMPKRSLARLLNSCHAGLMILKNVPAFYNGTSPNKFFDYISAGLPVVCNMPGWVATLVTQNQCGIAVPPDDPNAFADALIKMADRPSLLPKMGKRGRALAAAEFDRLVLARQWAERLERLMGVSPRKQRANAPHRRAS